MPLNTPISNNQKAETSGTALGFPDSGEPGSNVPLDGFSESDPWQGQMGGVNLRPCVQTEGR